MPTRKETPSSSSSSSSAGSGNEDEQKVRTPSEVARDERATLNLLLKMVPKLDGRENFWDWEDAILTQADWLAWPEGLLDDPVPWDPGAEETTEEKSSRRLAYAIILHTTRQYDFVLTDVDRGDARGAWKALMGHFKRKTQGNLTVEKRKFYSLSMSSTKLDVKQFARATRRCQKTLNFIGGTGTATDQDCVTVLLSGLLSQFKSRREHIEAAEVGTYSFAQMVFHSA